jgi:hypothetical protein
MKLVPLSQGMFAMVDDSDYEWLIKYDWHFAGGYARRTDRSSGKPITIWMHREIMNLGRWGTDNTEIDHLDRNRLNNQRCNLRITNHSENCKNRGKQKNKSSEFVGVHVYCDKPHYRATIKIEGKQTFLGRFPFTRQGEIEAAQAYDEAAKKHHGSNCYLNF